MLNNFQHIKFLFFNQKKKKREKKTFHFHSNFNFSWTEFAEFDSLYFRWFASKESENALVQWLLDLKRFMRWFLKSFNFFLNQYFCKLSTKRVKKSPKFKFNSLQFLMIDDVARARVIKRPCSYKNGFFVVFEKIVNNKNMIDVAPNSQFKIIRDLCGGDFFIVFSEW